jgi:hypothetical protein
LLVFAFLIALNGCAHSNRVEPGLSPPAVELSVSHAAGAAMSSSTTAPASRPVAMDDALDVVVEWFALRAAPHEGQPIGSVASVIASAGGGTQALLVAPRLLRGSRIVAPDQVNAFAERIASGGANVLTVGTSRGALPENVTATFALSSRGDPDRRIEVEVHRPPATAPANAVARIELIAQAPSTQPSPAMRERIALDPISIADPMRVALLIPFESGAAHGPAAIAALISIDNDQSPQHDQALARCVEDLRRSAASQPTSVAATQPSEWPELLAAASRLTNPADARRALLYLAEQTGATFAGDCALAADDKTLAELCTVVRDRMGAIDTPVNADRLGCIIDATCLAHLAALQSEQRLPSELSPAMITFAGEAGRHASSLEDSLRSASSRKELDARLAAENLIYLEDSAPAARVRAFDWLNAHGQAPPGFDPLAPLKQRRDALSNAMSKSSAEARHE